MRYRSRENNGHSSSISIWQRLAIAKYRHAMELSVMSEVPCACENGSSFKTAVDSFMTSFGSSNQEAQLPGVSSFCIDEYRIPVGSICNAFFITLAELCNESIFALGQCHVRKLTTFPSSQEAKKTRVKPNNQLIVQAWSIDLVEIETCVQIPILILLLLVSKPHSINTCC